GIQIVDIDHIYETESKWIDLLYDEAALDSDEEFKTLFEDVIRNFIRFVHLVPASENNHHMYAGGLVSHSLEVSLYALRNAQQLVLPAIGHVDIEKRYRQPRWLYASWLCGLLHDVGKPFTDFTVIGDNGGSWKPLLIPLYDWCKNNDIKSYTVIWNEHRVHKEHEQSSITPVQMILTDQVKEYLSESTDNLWNHITTTLAKYKHRNGYLDTAVRMADYKSTDIDNKRYWDKTIGHRTAPIQNHIIKAIRSLRKNWTTNKSGAKIWIVDDEVCLQWPQAINEPIGYRRSFR
ncbi:hypothetical protein LCGC14_3153600, partial [marine sediment metagenome]